MVNQVEYLIYTDEEWNKLPLETRRSLIEANSKRRELEEAISKVGEVINKEQYMKNYWKVIKEHLDRDLGPKLIIEKSVKSNKKH